MCKSPGAPITPPKKLAAKVNPPTFCNGGQPLLCFARVRLPLLPFVLLIVHARKHVSTGVTCACAHATRFCRQRTHMRTSSRHAHAHASSVSFACLRTVLTFSQSLAGPAPLKPSSKPSTAPCPTPCPSCCLSPSLSLISHPRDFAPYFALIRSRPVLAP